LQQQYDEIKETNILLSLGIKKKTEAIWDNVYSHLLYFRYDQKTFNKVINILKANELFPIKRKLAGKNNIVKCFLNKFPHSTYLLFNIIRKIF